jgi:hypothetical protein
MHSPPSSAITCGFPESRSSVRYGPTLPLTPRYDAPMHLVQLLLPLYDNAGGKLAPELFAQVREELVQRFGGLTAYTRAPASGLWAEDGAHVERDDIVVYEVMVDALDRGWWAQYRRTLEQRFGQDEIVIRAQAIERL